MSDRTLQAVQEHLAESIFEALRRQEVDAIVGDQQPLLLRPRAAVEALREREALFRVALKHTPIVIWQQDTQLRYRWIYNPQLGYHEEEVIGKRDLELLERRDEAERLEAFKREALEAGAVRRAMVPISRGRHRQYYDLTIEPLEDDGGQITGITCVAFNITDRREAEVERERTLTRLAELNETLEAQVRERTSQVRALSRSLTEAEQEEQRRIAEVLHDDIQQMLMALQIQLDLLRQSLEPDAQAQLRESAQFVGEIAEAARSLSTELAAPVLESINLRDTLRWLAEVMQDRYQFTVEVEAEGPCTIADRHLRQLLFRMVQELLFNAVKHAGVQQARLEVVDRDDEIVISVVDEGAGFEIDTLLHPARKGAGLGLFSVRERIRLFGGRFEIDSAPGAGTRATIIMPKQLP